MSVSWGILSTARINDWVLAATESSPGVSFVAVGGRDAERTRTWAAERGVERSYGSYEDLLADPELDAVYISLPNSLHVEWSIAALEAGKHVLCEKPLSRDPAQVARAAAVADREGLVLAEAFMYRYHPQTSLVRSLIATGAIGKLRHVNATMSFQLLDRTGDPRLSPALEGGSLMDTGCYCISAMRMFAGEPESVYGEYVRDGDGVDLRAMGLLRFGGEVTGQFDTAMTLPRRDRLELVGEAGSILVEDPWHCRLPAVEVRRPRSDTYEPPAPREGSESIDIDPVGISGANGSLLDAYRFEVEAVSAAVAEDRQPEFAARDAIAQAAALAAFDQSANSGRPVKPSTGPGGQEEAQP